MNVLIVVLDIIAVNAAYYIALYARFYGYAEISGIFLQKLTVWERFTPVYTIICLVVFGAFRLYSGMWKYAGVHDFNRILGASVVTSICLNQTESLAKRSQWSIRASYPAIIRFNSYAFWCTYINC